MDVFRPISRAVSIQGLRSGSPAAAPQSPPICFKIRTNLGLAGLTVPCLFVPTPCSLTATTVAPDRVRARVTMSRSRAGSRLSPSGHSKVLSSLLRPSPRGLIIMEGAVCNIIMMNYDRLPSRPPCERSGALHFNFKSARQSGCAWVEHM